MCGLRKRARIIVFYFLILLLLELAHCWLSKRLPWSLNQGFFSGLGVFSWPWIGGGVVLILVVLLGAAIWFKGAAVYPLGFLWAAGVVNFLDRVFFKGVRDYWQFWYWQNNLADWFIVLPVLWLLLLAVKKEGKNG